MLFDYVFDLLFDDGADPNRFPIAGQGLRPTWRTMALVTRPGFAYSIPKRSMRTTAFRSPSQKPEPTAILAACIRECRAGSTSGRGASASRFRSGPRCRLDNRHTARLGPADSLRRAASLRRLTFAPPRRFRRAASRAALFPTCRHRAFRAGDYFAGLPSCASAFRAPARHRGRRRGRVPRILRARQVVSVSVSPGGAGPARRDAQGDRRGAVPRRMLEIQTGAPQIY